MRISTYLTYPVLLAFSIGLTIGVSTMLLLTAGSTNPPATDKDNTQQTQPTKQPKLDAFLDKFDRQELGLLRKGYDRHSIDETLTQTFMLWMQNLEPNGLASLTPISEKNHYRLIYVNNIVKRYYNKSVIENLDSLLDQ